MKGNKRLFPLFFIFILLSMPFFINSGYSTDYNWISNNGFEDLVGYSTYVELVPNGFQNTTDDFTEYQAFPYIDTFDDLTGVGCTSSSEYMEHFTFENLPLNTQTVDNVSLIVRAHYSGSSGTMRTWLWDEDAGDWETKNQWGLTAVFQNITDDFSDIFSSVGYVNNAILKFGCVGGVGGIFIDAVTLKVGCYIGGDGQTDIGADTTPWLSYWEYFGSETYVGITSDEAYNGSYSGYLTYNNDPHIIQLNIIQHINFLTIENLSSVTAWCKTDSTTNVGVRCSLVFADNTISRDIYQQDFNSTNGWEQLTFTFTTTEGKLIVDIIFDLTSGDYGDNTYFDDIELNANVPVTTSRFEWYTTPDMDYQTPLTAQAVTKTNYVFYGIWYNASGEAVDSGTFEVSHDFGTVEGTISYGQFSFDIVQRPDTYNFKAEYITLTLDVDETGTYEFKIRIDWFKELDDGSGSTPPPERYDEENINFIYWLIYFMLLVMPALGLGVAFNSSKIDPIYGVIIGLLLSSYLLYRVDGSLFGTVICIVAIGALVFGKYRSSNQ